MTLIQWSVALCMHYYACLNRTARVRVRVRVRVKSKTHCIHFHLSVMY